MHPNALVTANNRNPITPLEGKFSVAFCIALGLRGYKATMFDFSEDTLRNPALTKLIPLVELEAVPSQDSQTAYLDVWLVDGTHLSEYTEIVKGHPDNPMTWGDLKLKFSDLVEPALGKAACEEIYRTVRDFECLGSLSRIMGLLSR